MPARRRCFVAKEARGGSGGTGAPAPTSQRSHVVCNARSRACTACSASAAGPRRAPAANACQASPSSSARRSAASSPSAPRCARSRTGLAAPLPSTISREVAARATAAATPTARTPPSNAPRRAGTPPATLQGSHASPRLCDRVRDDLRHGLSPEQIQGRLRVDFLNDPEMRISPETIYRTLYIQAPRHSQEGPRPLPARRARAIRTPQTRTTPQRETIPNAIPISQRPAGSRRPRDPRPLGRRPADRQHRHPDRHPRRAHHPLRPADPPRPAHRHHRHPRPHHRDQTPPTTTPPLPHLGPRRRDRQARRDQHRHRHPDLLLRPPKAPGNAVATKTPTASYASTSPKATPRRLRPDLPRRRRPRTQHPPPQNTRLPCPASRNWHGSGSLKGGGGRLGAALVDVERPVPGERLVRSDRVDSTRNASAWRSGSVASSICSR